MSTVQMLLQNEAYCRALESLLASEGVFEVERVSEPDFARDGVLVVDRNALQQHPALLQQTHRLVLIAPKDPAFMAELWEHNLRSVVFESDPPSTAVLAILGLDLGRRVPSGPKGPRLTLINGGAGAPIAGRISAKHPA